MGSGITYPHGGGPLWHPLVFSALRLPKAQNLVSDKYFDFFLSIEHQKQPPKWYTFCATGRRMTKLKNENFQAKNGRNFKF